jgi:pimeloyl-ACP methyl ester carboxylesterase
MLVVGGACDGLLPVAAIEATARAYAAPCVIVPGVGHDVMLDERWEIVAHHVDQWLASAQSLRGLPGVTEPHTTARS